MPEGPAVHDVRPEVEPTTGGLPQGGSLKQERERHTGTDLLEAAASGEKLMASEQGDLLDYFLTNEGLPGDDEPVPLEWTVGEGRSKRTNTWMVRTIAWEEWQDARERATDEKTGIFDAFVAASYTVARALVEPRLGGRLRKMQEEQGEKAPADAAALLRRMFRKQAGVLLEINGEVLRISKLQNDNGSVRRPDLEVEAGKS